MKRKKFVSICYVFTQTYFFFSLNEAVLLSCIYCGFLQEAIEQISVPLKFLLTVQFRNGLVILSLKAPLFHIP